MSVKALVELMREELAERQWSPHDLAIRMLVYEFQVTTLEVELMLACEDDPHVVVADETCARLDRAFGVSDGFCRRLADAPEVVAGTTGADTR